MMFRTVLSRDRIEDRRVDAFVEAIRASEHGPVPQLHDTAPLPMSLVRLLVPVAAAAVLTGCGATAPAAPAEESPASASTLTGTPEPAAPGLSAPEQLTGTDAGLITTPAPTVQQLEEQDAAAAPDAIPAVIPAPSPVVAPAPAPVAEEEPAGQQLPEEVVGSYRCEDPRAIVVAVNADGSWDCQVVDQ
jgi:hypothetical protein